MEMRRIRETLVVSRMRKKKKNQGSLMINRKVEWADDTEDPD